jgi:hypothetical protein
VKNDDRLKKGILAETKRAHKLKGRCIFMLNINQLTTVNHRYLWTGHSIPPFFIFSFPWLRNIYSIYRYCWNVDTYKWKVYNKTIILYNCSIVNFPFICMNIPVAPAYEVYISELIRYSRACGSYQDSSIIVLL